MISPLDCSYVLRSLHLKYLSNVQAAPEPEDLVQDAIADLMSGQRTWPSELPLNVVLYGIIRSRVSNFLKKHRALGLEDPGQLLDPAVAAEIPLDLLKGEIKNLVQDDSELKRIIDYMLEDPLLNPRDLANLMECPVARIYNAKKRLERKLSIFRKGLR